MNKRTADILLYVGMICFFLDWFIPTKILSVVGLILAVPFSYFALQKKTESKVEEKRSKSVNGRLIILLYVFIAALLTIAFFIPENVAFRQWLLELFNYR